MPNLLVSFRLSKRVFIRLFWKLFVSLKFFSALSKLFESFIDLTVIVQPPLFKYISKAIMVYLN